MKEKSKYLSSAGLMLLTSVLVKIIGAVYKIPLTAFIGAVGRGYFATAYNLYLPVHAVLLGALPIALSRLVSKYHAVGNSRMLASLKKASGQIFCIAGIGGTALLVLAAKPYAALIAGSPNSLYTMLVLSPSLLLSCLSGCYRGYYEGFMNMKPTAVSQTLEALLKMLFGLLFARVSMAYLYNQYTTGGAVFATPATSREAAMQLIYPYTSAAAMLGVTAGTLLSLLYLVIYDAGNRGERLHCSAAEGRRELLSFSLPIMLSGAVQSVFQFLDTASVQYALSRVGGEAIKNAYAYGIRTAAVSDGDLRAYAFGLFSTALDFKNLVPGITMALGVRAVPALCREYEQNEHQALERMMNLIYKYTAVLSVAGGFGIALVSKELLSLFYAATAPDIVSGCEELVCYFGLSVPLYSLASTAVFCVQALGKPEKSVLPYIVSGVLRVALNLLLIQNKSYLLFGAVISGAVGYAVLFLMNYQAAKRLSGVKISRMKALIMPVLCGLAALFLTKVVYGVVSLSKFNIFNLLIKLIVFSGIYCILCFLCRIFKLREIFSGISFKKMA